MKKFTFLFCATFVALGLVAQASESGLKQLWKSTDYSWNAGNLSRSIAYYDGKIYVPENNGANSAVHVINAITGVEDAGAKIAHADFQSFGIAVDNAGHLILPKNTAGASDWILSKVDIATGTVTAMNEGKSFNTVNRIDYLAIYGNIESAGEPAYIIGASTTTPPIKAWEIKSGDLTATPVFSWSRPAASVAADIKWIDATHFLLTQQNTAATPKPYIMTVDFSATDYITKTEEINLTSTIIGGGAYFKLKDKPYIVFPTGTDAQYGAVGIFDISDIENPVAVGDVTAAIGNTANGALHLGIEAVKIADDKAIIYVWSPNNGAAAYEFTAGETSINKIPAKSDIFVKPTTGGIEIQLEATSVIELYSVGGSLIDKTIAAGTYTRTLAPGVYVVRVNGSAMKFVKM